MFSQTKSYPNNTLLEDLSKCHNELNTVLWPRANRACGKSAPASSIIISRPPPFEQLSFEQSQQQNLTKCQLQPAKFKHSPTGRRKKRPPNEFRFQMPDTIRSLNLNVSSVLVPSFRLEGTLWTKKLVSRKIHASIGSIDTRFSRFSLGKSFERKREFGASLISSPTSVCRVIFMNSSGV